MNNLTTEDVGAGQSILMGRAHINALWPWMQLTWLVLSPTAIYVSWQDRVEKSQSINASYVCKGFMGVVICI